MSAGFAPPAPEPTRRRRVKRAAVYLTVAAGIVALYSQAVITNASQTVRDQVVSGLLSAANIAVNEMETWTQLRRVQAVTLAQVSEQLAPDSRTASHGGGHALAQLMDSLRVVGGFTEAWALDTAGVVIARTSGAGDIGLTTPGVRVVRTPRGAFVDVTARGERRGAPTIVIRSAFNADAFQRLNPTRYATTMTTRTDVLYPSGDSVHVLFSGARDTSARAASYAAAELPETYRRALATANASGEGVGVGGTRVYYAATRLPSLALPVVREVTVREVLQPLRGAVYVQAAFVAALLLALMWIAESRWRALRARREQELTRLQGEFVASVSHELRTPLAQIRMYAELMHQGRMSAPGDTARALNVIEKEARRLTMLVDNILNFTRLRRTSRELAAQATEVAEEIREAITAFAPLAASAALTVSSEASAGLYAMVDSLALRQVLLNFLENAMKYGPRGQAIVVGAERRGTEVAVWVDDQGPGVPPADRERIWEPFFRGASTASTTTGSGIGLAVVRDLVTRSGGRVAVTGAPGGGARFVATFVAASPPSGIEHSRARALASGR